ncbi:urea transporter [Georgenia sp. 311]|uniref:Urea transporter n=1 Tax=Georgenia wutianyii TaxID=2585135 RepID=A0ABX5VLC5_9MICO|nr:MULTISPECIES: urea transporter [Georgenia]QDB79272.1 urea transporter [Georgenia wutianyii]TNC18938.1 urea transporter [Georgenia sp. 311]
MTTPSEQTGLAPWGFALLRGPSQIFFQVNVITGLLVLAAFFIADWRMGVLALIGALGGALGGRAMGYPPSNVASGMQSFSGTLVGAAVFAALGGDEWWCYALAFGGGLLTGPVTWLIDALFSKTALKKYNLPYTTAPFVIVATIIVLSTTSLAVSSSPSDLPDEPVQAFFLSLLTNVSQVVLVDNPFAGAAILLGLFIASWRVGLAGLLGSALGSLTAIAMGEQWSEIANGLANYSGVLTAIALCVTFLKSSTASWLYSLPWIVVTAVVTLLMHRLGLETYTWPYILTTWVALIVAYSVKGLDRS